MDIRYLCTPQPNRDDRTMPPRDEWRAMNAESPWRAAGLYAMAFCPVLPVTIMVTREDNYEDAKWKPATCVESFNVSVDHKP